jgi:excisionase family DNA binding protein
MGATTSAASLLQEFTKRADLLGYPPEHLSVEQSAAVCGISHQTIRAMYRDGRLKFRRIGGNRKYIFKVGDLAKALA